eukprot:CAMPEP_0174749746 /NCGR_PEP_ID=MMETSP1094-20130205/96315_1 /TAXON_ID=156173 /ORGANISM="Chrysochromulina brevifilum, Strain UTEX LB 985" /LENGTH=35 /DNA_ID= /DNA_START= /DNA_END= /DNA_ORIENTATION=
MSTPTGGDSSSVAACLTHLAPEDETDNVKMRPKAA